LELSCLVMLYLVAMTFHVGCDLDELAYCLHRPMVYSSQRGGQIFLSGATPSCHVAVGGGVFPADAKPLGLDILLGVDCLGTYKTEFYMEKPALTWVCLSDVRVIMAMMPLPLVESLCEVAMGWIPAFEYLMPGAC
jgi:hypothetical protein